VLLLYKILLILSVIGILRCSDRFTRMSREFDDEVVTSVRRIMRATEDHGYPPHLIPLLILLTAFSFLLSAYVTGAVGR
jgi:hypothetical protein